MQDSSASVGALIADTMEFARRQNLSVVDLNDAMPGRVDPGLSQILHEIHQRLGQGSPFDFGDNTIRLTIGASPESQYREIMAVTEIVVGRTTNRPQYVALQGFNEEIASMRRGEA